MNRRNTEKKKQTTKIHNNVLEINQLTKTYYGKKNVQALKSVNLNCSYNEIIGLLGDNGAGKTTLMKCVANIIQPTSGEIYLNGVNLQNMSQRDKASAMFFVAEGTRSLWWRLTLEENIRFVSEMMWGNWQSVKNELTPLLKLLKMTEKKDTVVGQLSRGQQQKICILLAMLSPTSLIIMDEPTLGLDVSSRQEIAELILLAKLHSSKKTFLISSHDMSFISKVAERVMILKHGEIIADSSFRDLKTLMQKKQQRICIHGKMDKVEKEEFGKFFPVTLTEETENNISFEVSYELHLVNKIVDYLRAHEKMIESMEKQEMDLEKLFLELQMENTKEKQGGKNETAQNI